MLGRAGHTATFVASSTWPASTTQYLFTRHWVTWRPQVEPVVFGSTRMDSRFQVLWEDDDRIFCRASHPDSDGGCSAVLAVLPKMKHAPSASLDRLAHEFGLKDQLDGAWAMRPLGLECDGGRPVLLLEDSGGEPLERLLGAPMEASSTRT